MLRVAVIAAGAPQPITQIVRTLPEPLGFALVVLASAEPPIAEQFRLATSLPVTEVKGRM